MKLTDEQLLAAISAEEESALGSIQGDIASDRADAIDRYLGKPYGDEIKGRSSVVSRDVADVVEGVLANVLKPFVAGDRIVQFDPRGPEDEEQAQQETDYVNYIALERNNGFLALCASVKDALLLRNGYIRCDWTTRDDVKLETYRGMSDEEVAVIAEDKEVEITGHNEIETEDGLVHDISLRRKNPIEYVSISPLAPDKILVSERLTTPSVQDADFVQIREMQSLSQLRQAGYDIPDDISDDDKGETIEELARERFPSMNREDDMTGDPARRLVLYKETYIRLDRDGDGVAELRRVCTVGRNLLADDEVEFIPVAAFTGTLMAHQHLGMSIYDMVADLARLKTALWRQYMDNKYLANNGRTAVDYNKVNLDDLMVSRPGGVVRVEGPPAEAVMPLEAPDTGTSAIQGLEYLDSVRENRTGYTRYAQGMDSDSLINKTATGLVQATSQSQMRLEMVARTIAETGVRDLFRIIHALTLKHSTRAEKVRLRGRWVPIDPRSWVKRFDLSISVGLGVGNSEQQFGKLMSIAPLLQPAAQQGLVGPQEVYNFAAELVKSAGFKNPDRFVKRPEIDPQTGEPKVPPPPPNPLVEAEKVKQQGEAMKVQAQGQMKMQELAMQDQAKQREAQRQYELQQANDQRQAELDRMEHEDAMRLKQYEIDKKAETDIKVAMISRGVDLALSEAQDQATKASESATGAIDAINQAAQQLGQIVASFQTMLSQLSQDLKAHAEVMSMPRQVVRDPMTGRAKGSVPVRSLQ